MPQDFTGQNLSGHDFRNANLEGAIFFQTILRDADFRGANLSKATMQFADLQGANLERARCFKTVLTAAKLIRANLRHAQLAEAHLVSVDLYDADLTGANLRGADLRHSSATEANFTDADLTVADLEGANLRRANFEHTNMDRANLTRSTGAELRGAWAVETIIDTENHPPAGQVRAFGRKTRALSKLRKQPLPLKAGAFKRAFPAEFEAVKDATLGRDFTPEMVQKLSNIYGFNWIVTEGKYRSSTQRICPEPNELLKFNIRMDSLGLDQTQFFYLERIRESAMRSGHPYEGGDLFTVGWVRYCDNPETKTFLVEEVQSDIQAMQKGMKDPQFKQQLRAFGMSETIMRSVVDLLAPLAERFYEDALGVVFDRAEAQGFEVEMLNISHREVDNAPRSIYTDLPRKMGMRPQEWSSTYPDDIADVWHYRPNGFVLQGPLAPLYSAMRDAENIVEESRMEVKDSLRELGLLMNEQVRLISLGATPGTPRLKSLANEEARIRSELAFARELLEDAEKFLERRRQELSQKLRS